MTRKHLLIIALAVAALLSQKTSVRRHLLQIVQDVPPPCNPRVEICPPPGTSVPLPPGKPIVPLNK